MHDQKNDAQQGIKKKEKIAGSGPLFALFSDMETQLTSIKGIIIPASWDTNGTILSTAIVTFTEDMFAVTDSDCGRSLTLHLRETVTVTGRVSVHGSSKRIHVQDFQIHIPGEGA